MEDEEVSAEAVETEEQDSYEQDEEEQSLIDEANADAPALDAALAVEEEESEPDPEPVKARPPVAGASGRLDRLKANLDPEIFEDLMGYVEERVQHGISTSAYANVQAQQAAQQMPNLFKIHGPQIQQYVNELSPELRTSPNAIRFAVGRLVMEETEASDGDIAATLARLSKLAGNAPVGKKAPAKSAPPVSQRVPVGGASTGSPRVPPSTLLDRQIATLVSRYGVSKAEAKEMLQDERIR